MRLRVFIVERITVVKFGVNDRGINRTSSWGIEVRPVTAKLTNVIAAGVGERCNLVRGGKTFVKDKAKTRVGVVKTVKFKSSVFWRVGFWVRWVRIRFVGWCVFHGLIAATLFLLVHQGQYWTSYGVCWTLLRVSSRALGSLTATWIRYCVTNFTGSTSPTGCFSSWQWQFTGVWTAAHAVPVGLLRSGRRCRHSAAPAFRQPTACSTSLPNQHLRPSGLFSCRPHSLELSPGFHPGPVHQCRLFQTFS